jgi:arginine exporter protein ArgO
MWLVIGLFAGSAAWWFALAFVVGTFRQRFVERSMRQLNKISGMIIALSGAGVLAAAAFHAINP